MYLEKINFPSDIKSYSLDEMKELAKEMRTAHFFCKLFHFIK